MGEAAPEAGARRVEVQHGHRWALGAEVGPHGTREKRVYISSTSSTGSRWQRPSAPTTMLQLLAIPLNSFLRAGRDESLAMTR
eukprot:7384334-Prymnesium_polylepis.2